MGVQFESYFHVVVTNTAWKNIKYFTEHLKLSTEIVYHLWEIKYISSLQTEQMKVFCARKDSYKNSHENIFEYYINSFLYHIIYYTTRTNLYNNNNCAMQMFMQKYKNIAEKLKYKNWFQNLNAWSANKTTTYLMILI